MSGTAPQIEWYIARDGAQHGPVSDVEMRKVVELGHLRPNDLVWCAKFTEWKRASDVFPAPPPPAPPMPAPVAPPMQAPTAAPRQQVAAPGPAVPAPQANSIRQEPRTGPGSARPAAGPLAGPAAASPASPASGAAEDAAWAQAMRDVLRQPGGGAQSSYSPRDPAPQPVQPALQPAARLSAPVSDPFPQYQPQAGPGFGRLDPAPTADPRAGLGMPPADEAPDDVAEPAPERRRDWVGRSAAVLAVLLVLGGLGWVGWQNRAFVGGASAIGEAIKAKVSSGPPAEAYRLSPYEAPGETRDLIDAAFQRTALWRVLKRDHPEWYAERLADIERMRGQKQDEKIVQRFIADVIVTLRRRNAQAALQSSPDHLRAMARTFGENLRQLASRDGSTCFAFITYGEANPFLLELSRTPAFAETLQRQLIAIFEAISNGRANRMIHATTRRADYDQLTKELTTRGWSQADLATFSDPQRLSTSPPDKVCTLVQDWFNTHLALTDKELQSRLLAESLKPLVGG